MPRRLRHQFIVGVRRLAERLLDPDQIVKHLRREGGVREIYGSCGDHMLSTSSARANASNSRVCPFWAAATSAPGSTCALANEQLIRRMAGQAQDWFGHDAEHEGRHDAQAHRGAGEHA